LEFFGVGGEGREFRKTKKFSEVNAIGEGLHHNAEVKLIWRHDKAESKGCGHPVQDFGIRDYVAQRGGR
jgi:hypothetical protein